MALEYSALSDDKLLALFRRGDGAAGSELAVRYRPLIKRCTRPYFLVGGDSEDLIQEGMIGLVSSMQSYNAENGAAFRSYAELCIRRRILSAIKAASRFKHMPLNYRLSLEELYGEDGEALPGLPDEKYNRSPEDLIIEREKKNDLYMLCRALLSPLEKGVLALYLEGLSYEEIGQCLGLRAGTVKSRLARAREQLRRALEEVGNKTPSAPSKKAERG